MRRSPRASSFLFVLATVAGCHERRESAPGAPAPGATLAIEPAAATPAGGHALRHVQRLFHHRLSRKQPERPVLEAAAVDGFVREGDGETASLLAIPSAPLRQVAPTQVRLPVLFDGALRVASGGLEVAVRPIGLARSKVEWAQRVAIHPDVAPGVTAFRRVDADGVEDWFQVDRGADTLSFSYDVTLGPTVAGLRLIEGTLELLDAHGTPRLRAPAPFAIDAAGARRVGAITVRGCAVDRDPRGPWGRAVTAPGSDRCIVEATIDGRGLVYPVLVDPAWTSTGNTKQTHAYHALLRLTGGSDTGKVLLVGGTGTVPTLTELFDPATSTWASSSSMPDSLGEGMGAVALSNGTVVVAGGFPVGGTLTAKGVVMVRSAGGTWSYGAAMSTARAWHVMQPMTVDGKEVAFVAGGRLSDGLKEAPIKAAQFYDPVADDWTMVPSMSAERSSAGSAVLSDGRLLVVGGHGYASSPFEHKTAEIFDPTTKTWSSGGSLITERSDAAVIALPSGKAVAIGGWNDLDYTLRTLEYFDGSAWSAIAGKGMTEPRMFHVTARLDDGRVLIAGGNVEPDDPRFWMTETSTVDLLDLGADPKTTAKIVSTGGMAVPRIYGAGVSLGQKVLVTGGLTADSTAAQTNSSEIYDATLGAACATSATCAPGLSCTDGVCCTSASCPEGQTCAAPGFEGVCTKPKGSSCTSNAECATGYCVTGVCCETACAGGCRVCNEAGKEGTCTEAAAGTDPTGYCGGDPICGPMCDGKGECWYEAPEGTACGASASDAGTGAFCEAYACDFFADCAKTTHDCGLKCTTKVSCDEATKTCTATPDDVKAGFCVIDGACVGYGDPNPTDPCLVCDPPVSKLAWSPAPFCADGGVPDAGDDTGAVDDVGVIEDTGTKVDGGAPADTGGTPPKDSGTVSPDASVDDAAVPVAESLPEGQACSCDVPGARRTGNLGLLSAAVALAFVRRRARAALG